MALLFLGKTQCPLCGEIIYSENDVYMFSHFISQNNRLWKYSDSSIHKNCFDKWKDKNEFLELYKIKTGQSYF